ncbi:hypothetical protein HHL16_21680 [Pseudoflavitalea sp. G-6-1-2]|uniref:hypothetical protein n=1 Tax=Pseudoflavitalea sp. G-6-1-2 TaxID=2728841 RepID=UPI00146CF862|nr:hypothetical protein [Pseudoflavitalea sp. G-6-1-2]NML23506.1 hypothetical protein [Pseudoflavitalea sp. G-6-1-2]
MKKNIRETLCIIGIILLYIIGEFIATFPVAICTAAIVFLLKIWIEGIIHLINQKFGVHAEGTIVKSIEREFSPVPDKTHYRLRVAFQSPIDQQLYNIPFNFYGDPPPAKMVILVNRKNPLRSVELQKESFWLVALYTVLLLCTVALTIYFFNEMFHTAALPDEVPVEIPSGD